jgi:23S rRNA (uracil1939-C5)-methyltransferase
VQLKIEKLVYGGDGLSRVDGEVIFTPFVLPAEQVTVERIPSRKGASRSRLIDVLEPSPDRVTARCPVFTKCGGCQYQHISYEAQLALKREILAETLRRVARIDFPVEQIKTEASEPWGYRNRVQFHMEGGEVGYRAMGSRRLVSTDECPISSPMIGEALRKLNEMAKDRRWPNFLQSLELFTNEEQLQWNVVETDKPIAMKFFDWLTDELPGSVPGPLRYEVNGDIFDVHGKSFFQVNRFLLPRLAELVLGDAQGDTAWDLYSGVGLFSLPLARRFRHVTAVESGRSAVRDLKGNAQAAGVDVRAIEEPTDGFLARAEKAPDFVVADPPREGLGKAAVASLLKLKPETLVIVACDPATLARDLAELQSGYEIAEVTLVDLFPQTFHMETIVRLRRGSRP